MLFELFPNSTCKLVAQGVQKDAKNIRNCLKLLNEVGEDTPRFVSLFLDELSPVTFNSLDISCRLGKIEELGADIHAMTRALSMQASACNDLRVVTTDINEWLCAIEQSSINGGEATLGQRVGPGQQGRLKGECGELSRELGWTKQRSNFANDVE